MTYLIEDNDNENENEDGNEAGNEVDPGQENPGNEDDPSGQTPEDEGEGEGDGNGNGDGEGDDGDGDGDDDDSDGDDEGEGEEGEEADDFVPAAIPDEKDLMIIKLRNAYEQTLREFCELKALISKNEKAKAEREEFERLFPGVPFDEIPDEVLSSDLPLAAAYALYERKAAIKAEKAKIANEENRTRSTGALGSTGADDDFYSLAEIRSMSAEDVRKNYGRILKSLSRKGK